MSLNKDSDNGICILSFDNGGPGTYSQLLILKELMSRMASDLQVAEDDVYPADHFDLMGGVGFGGLVALMLGHLRMNVNEAIDALLDITFAIFSEGSRDHQDIELNAKNLKNAVENMLQTKKIALATRMNEETRPQTGCRIALYAATSADISHPHAFRTYPSRGSGLNPTIVDAACATMSTPPYFSPVKIGPPRRQQSFVGGAFGANNPTRLLLNEAGMVFGKNRRVTEVLSLGCGLPRVLSVDSSSELDVDRLVKDITVDCETVARDLSVRLFSVNAYLRLNVDRGMEHIKMGDWDDLGAIESHTTAYLATSGVSGAIDSSIRHMKGRIATVTLGQLNHTSTVKVMAKKAPPVSPYFVPRKRPWDSMIHHLVASPLSRQKIFPITGMGGCGKTQLISYFLQEHPNLYKYVVFVDASSSSNIQADLQTWAQTLGDDREGNMWEDAIRILSSCSQDEQWAVVFDNADDSQLKLSPYLPNNANVTIFITSRNRDLGVLSTTHHLELGEMSDEEALEALLKAARRQLLPSDGELESSRALIKELGCLAVAVVQAGTYCYRLSSTVGDIFQPYTFTQYLSLFSSHRAELMKKTEPASLDSYERGAYATLDLSYNALPKAPRGFLNFISFFHHTGIPLEAFATAANNGFKGPYLYLPRPNSYEDTILELEQTLCNGGKWNELRVQEIIQTLHSFSLLTTTSVHDSVILNMHPLIQKWSRDMDSSASMRFKSMTAQVLVSCGVLGNIRLNRNILPHILDMLIHTELKDLHVNDLMTFGVILRDHGHYQKAARIFHHVLEVMEASAGSESVTTLNIYSWLGDVYLYEGKWNEAETLLETLLQKRRTILGEDHQDTIEAAGNLAATYLRQERYKEAEKLGVEVLDKRKRILGMEHPDTIKIAGNLTITYYSQGRYEEAETLGVEVLELCKRILGMENPYTITSLGILATTYLYQGRYEEAEILEVEVLGQRKQILGMEHPDTIIAMANLAATYGKQGRWEEDAALLAPAVQLYLKVLGREHPHAQNGINSLAYVYDKLGKQKEAEEMKALVL